MLNLRRVPLLLAAGLYSVMWAGGVVAYLFRGGPGPHEAWTAPAFLALAAAIVLATSPARQARWLVIVLLAGYASEYLAVQCDCIFGPYFYTDVLAPRLLGVPVVMSAAWMVLIAYVKGMLLRRRLSAWMEIAVASAWMTAIDTVIDPVAAGPLRYWQWQIGGPYYGIPWSNFAGWFVVSAVIFALLRVDATPWRDNRWALHVGASIILFFAIIAFSHGLWLCGAAGVLLLGLHWRVIRKLERRDMQP